MLASLPMYDLPVVRPLTDAWWQGLAGHLRAAGLGDVPAELARSPAPAADDEAVLLTQVCGYPLTHALAGRVEPVAVPSHALPDCPAGHYRSLITVAADNPARGLGDLAGGVCAVNALDSHSGCNALRAEIAPLAGGAPFFDRVVVTGSHVASLAAVATGAADVCALDAVTHALLLRHQPAALQATRVLATTPVAPALPYVAGPGVGATARRRLRLGLGAAFADPELAAVRRELLLDGFVTPEAVDYSAILARERAAFAAGYPRVA